jgi:hypothetical protein
MARGAGGRLTRAVIVLAVVDLAAAAELGLSLALPQGKAPTKHRAAPTSVTTKPPGTPTTTLGPSQAPRASRARQTTSSAPAPAPQAASVGRPVLVSVAPRSAKAGQVVTISGHGFFSANGRITVTFGRVTAPVACPTRTTCRATVPAHPGPAPSGLVDIRLTTQSGTSNSLPFSYR